MISSHSTWVKICASKERSPVSAATLREEVPPEPSKAESSEIIIERIFIVSR
jgi:hypothetical protein